MPPVCRPTEFKGVTARGGYSQKNWVGVCGPLPKTLILFMTKICDFPYPIYDLTKNLIPYFVKGFCCLYFLAYIAAGGEAEEGKARMEGGGHDRGVASSKKVHSRLQSKNRYPIYDQNGGKIAKIDTHFMTKTAEKPYPLEPHIPI